MKQLLKYSERIKHLPRSGWLRVKINNPETVGAHSWQMSLIALYLSTTTVKEEYDLNHVIKLCICHDLAESKIGDITPIDAAYSAKGEKEQVAMQEIARESDFPLLIELFAEYKANQTPEARLANDLDKIDMLIQAFDYETRYSDKKLDEFKQSALKNIHTEIGKKIAQEIIAYNNLNNKKEPTGLAGGSSLTGITL